MNFLIGLGVFTAATVPALLVLFILARTAPTYEGEKSRLDVLDMPSLPTEKPGAAA